MAGDPRPLRLLDALELTLPAGFAERGAGQGLAFTGPAGEDLRIGVAAVEGGGPEAQQALLRDRLVQGGIKDAQRAACQPGLEVVVPVAKAEGAPGVETWNLVARSDEGRLFAQAVVASERAVAVLAYDGRNTRESIERWFSLLESVRPAGA